VVKVDGNAEVSGKAGVYYKLARTAVHVDLVVTKVEKIKGPYAQFAGKYLGLSNVIDQNSTDYQLTNITLTPVVSADPDQNYFIECNPSDAAQKSLQLVLSESGILLNTTGEEQILAEDNNQEYQAEESNIYPDVFKYFSDLNLFEQVDTIIERVNIDTATIEKMVFRRTLVEKTPEQKAKDAADFIMKVKENRLNLISGYQEVNYDKETFTLMNSELEKLENEYQKLFTGLTFTKTLEYHFSYIPSQSKQNDTVALFRLSNLKGVLDTSNINGEPVFLTINAANGNQAITDYVSKQSSLKNKGRGYYYRFPEFAEVTIILGNKTRIKANLPVNQFGVITWLPASKAALSVYPSTSGIRKISY
jgi:hypothetical protein